MTSLNNSSPNSGKIDKAALYGDFRDHQARRQKLSMKAAYKALDIADDEMEINARTENKSGIGALGAVGLAAVAGGLPMLGMWLGGAFDDRPPLVKPDPPAVVQPAEPGPAVEPEEKPPVVIREPGRDFDWRVGEPLVE